MCVCENDVIMLEVTLRLRSSQVHYVIENIIALLDILKHMSQILNALVLITNLIIVRKRQHICQVTQDTCSLKSVH